MSSRTNTLRMGLIRESLLRFNEHKEMNKRMSIDGKFFADLAKEVGLNTSHLDVLGERQAALGDCRWRRFAGTAGWYSAPVRTAGRDGR